MAVVHEGERVLKAIAPTDRFVRAVGVPSQAGILFYDSQGADSCSLLRMRHTSNLLPFPCILLPPAFQPCTPLCPLPVPCRVVLLDERGRELTSEDLARLLGAASDQGWQQLAFVIGGPFGHAPEVRRAAVHWHGRHALALLARTACHKCFCKQTGNIAAAQIKVALHW